MAGEDRSSVSVLVPEELEEDESGVVAPVVAARAGIADEPDWDTMTVEQKLDYNQRRRDQIFG